MDAARRDLRSGSWLGRVLSRVHAANRLTSMAGVRGEPDAGKAVATFESLAAEIVHELRNPLGALSGEIELALRRERSVAEYRAALRRISEQVSELESLTSDVALIAGSRQPRHLVISALAASELLAGVAALALPADAFSLQPAGPELHLLGEPRRLSRALELLVQYAVRHRRPGALVHLRLFATEQSAWAQLIIDASAPGFLPHTWRYLGMPASGAESTPGQLRPRMACRFIEQCGGFVTCAGDDGSESVHVRLPRVVPGTDRG